MGVFKEWLQVIETVDGTSSADHFKYLRSLVPHWPNYVIYDYLYKGHVKDPSKTENFITTIFPKAFGVQTKDVQWVNKVIPITLDVFEPNSREILEESMKGQKMKGATDDAKRHDTQKTLLAAGPSKEPIILASTPQGYYLLEGRHRTTQSLINWPKGYNQNAWFFKAAHLNLR